jgi:hypothetical protein
MTMTINTTKTSDDHGNLDGGRGVLMVIAVMTFVAVLMVVMVMMPLSECFSFPCHFSFLQLLFIH